MNNILTMKQCNFDDMVSDLVWDTIAELGVDFNSNIDQINEAIHQINDHEYLNDYFKKRLLITLEELADDLME